MPLSPAELALPVPADVRRLFDAASDRFDSASVVHDETRVRLLERLQYTKLEPGLIVDVGCATGAAVSALRARYPDAHIVAVDSSTPMAGRAAARAAGDARFAALAADACRLPLADASVDLLLANQLLPFVRPDLLFAEAARVLAPHGLMLFATVGPDTLRELRRAWAAADDRIHVHAFVDMHDIGDLAAGAGLAEPVLDVDRIALTYRDTASMLRDLRACGAVNVAGGRRRGLTGHGRWQRFEAGLEAIRNGERFAVTVELVLGQAWGRVRRVPAAGDAGGEVAVPVSRIGRSR